MIQAVLFDVGDTLLHFETAKARRFVAKGARPAHERLCEIGFDPPAYESYVRAIKRSFQWAYVWSRLRRREAQLVRAFKRAHHRMGIYVDDEQMNDLALRCTSPFRRFFTMDEETTVVVERLAAAKFKLGLVSNTLFPGLSDVRYMKPHRKIFRLALDQLGVPAGETLFVGDRMDNDVKGPSRVGMKTALFVRNGSVPRSRYGPDHIIRRLSEVPVILQT
jgi:FMN phosphatase YigB (HAD superfamily)